MIVKNQNLSRKKERKKEQGASGILTSVGIKTPLSRVSLVGPLLF